MKDLGNAAAFSQVLRLVQLRFAPTRRKTKVQNLPLAPKQKHRILLGSSVLFIFAVCKRKSSRLFDAKQRRSTGKLCYNSG